MSKRGLFLSIMLIALSILATACASAFASTNKPTVVIALPASNSQFHTGDQVTVQSSATGSDGISRVELSVDGNVVRTDSSPAPQPAFTVDQVWTATAGTHLISVRAYDTASVASDPAAINVTVLPAPDTPTPIPTPTSTPVASRACTNVATFVADITVPDGAALAAGQTFNKIWRVRNAGTCTWNASDVFVFIGGEAMTATPAIAVPTTVPGATADLLIAMTAPATPGLHTGSWRMKNASGTLFGATLTATINVVVPPPSCPFTPNIASFNVSPTTITAGQSATLSWGAVTGAERADIDNGIGGVATPGSISVNPTTTTTYTLTATCGSKSRTAQVTLTVVSPSATPTAVPTDTPTPTATATP